MAKFNRECLSARENQVLDFAIEGFTDAQIAHRLNIALSTVNSYWVRIRGKIGHFSRTELVASVLKSQAQNDIGFLSQQKEEYERILGQQEQLADDLAHISLYRTALELVPDALFVVDETGRFLFTNWRFEAMFFYSSSELKALNIDDLIPPRRRTTVSTVLQLLTGQMHSAVLGIDQVIYGRTKSATPIRILVSLDSRTTGNATLITGLVRNFVDDIDLRRKYASSYALLS